MICFVFGSKVIDMVSCIGCVDFCVNYIIEFRIVFRFRWACFPPRSVEPVTQHNWYTFSLTKTLQMYRMIMIIIIIIYPFKHTGIRYTTVTNTSQNVCCARYDKKINCKTKWTCRCLTAVHGCQFSVCVWTWLVSSCVKMIIILTWNFIS